MLHEHRYCYYPIDWDVSGFTCREGDCDDELACSHCGATLFEISIDRATGRHTWYCWHGGCGMDVTEYIDGHRYYCTVGNKVTYEHVPEQKEIEK